MNYKKYINQKVINKNNEIGLVVSFDDEHITVKYLDRNITYNFEVSFKNKYLSFIDSNLQSLVEQNLLNKEDQTLQKEKMFEENNKIVIKRNKVFSSINWFFLVISLYSFITFCWHYKYYFIIYAYILIIFKLQVQINYLDVDGGSILVFLLLCTLIAK